MESRVLRGEVERILSSIVRLGEASNELIRQIQNSGGEQTIPRCDQVIQALLNAQSSLGQAAGHLDSIRTSEALGSHGPHGERPSTKPTLFPFHVAVGPDVTNAIVSCEKNVSLMPDFVGNTLHEDLRVNFFPSAIGSQPFLFPLLSFEQCCLFFDDMRPIDELDQPRKLQPGFTTAAIFGLSTKLLRAETTKKAVLVLRGSTRKLQRVDLLLDVVRTTRIQVANLTSPTRAPPESLDSALPRLIVCSPRDFVDGRVNTDDIHHLIFDDVSETDADFLRQNLKSFRSLVDVSFRGPSRMVEKFPAVNECPLTVRMWMYSRHMSIYDTQPFSLARDVEGLFLSFPANQKLVMFTSDPRAHLNGVTIVHSIDTLAQEVDHLVVVETPSQIHDMRNLLKKCCAKYVTLVCFPNVSRKDLAEALVLEKFAELPYGLKSFVDSHTSRSLEGSPAPVAPITNRY